MIHRLRGSQKLSEERDFGGKLPQVPHVTNEDMEVQARGGLGLKKHRKPMSLEWS